MKYFFSVLFLVTILPIGVLAYTSPGKSQGFVSDYAKIISTSDISAIESQLKSLKDTTGVEVAVVTVPSLGDEVVETYAVKLFEEWGIGTKGRDNGLLILVAPNDRSARIEVGYGLEGVIPDTIANNIVLREMIPEFKVNNYSQGIVKAVNAVNGIILNTTDTSIYSAPPKKSQGFYFEVVIFFFFVIANVLGQTLSKTKSWWMGGLIGAGIGVVISLFIGFLFYGLGAIVLLTIAGLIFDYYVSKIGPKGPGGHGGFWFGGSGGHGGGGGFGGFGGGLSGGGGASGRW